MRFPCLLTISCCLLMTPAWADFAAGLSAFQKGDYSTAMKEWRPIADSGDAAAQFNLGLMYYDGQGVPQDYSQASNWFLRSAEQGYEKAQLNLGAMYGVGKGVRRDYVQAYKWLNLCAAQGDSKCVEQRDLVAKKLSPTKLTAAQKLATEFTPKKKSGN